MLNYISLFSGIGAFEKALTNLEVQYELVHWCEFDKHAAKSYSLIHNTPAELNLGDITTVNESELPNVDLITYGFPCQDISLAGKQKGLFNEDGSTTRSGLFFDALRIIEHCRPKIAIAENVKNLTSKKFKEQFEIVLNSLESAGYVNYWKILDAKDYVMPQHRERVFIVSIRKDIDKGFDFPEAVPLELRLKDMLEDDVDEKYFINTDKTFDETSETKSNAVRIGNYYGEQFGTGYAGNVWDKNGLCPTLMTMCGGGRQPHVQIRTLKKDEVRIRKLTPKECFRLQGFDDKDIDVCIDGGLSNTQLYKQAGNSICVPVIEAIFRSLGDVYDIFTN